MHIEYKTQALNTEDDLLFGIKFFFLFAFLAANKNNKLPRRKY